MELIRSAADADRSLIINVIRRSLRCIDTRLVDHGERVAYISGIIAEKGKLGLDRQKLLVLCILHDIGAYKTEEINNMVKFETSNVSDHTLYGYAFLNNTTKLGRYAEAILYHHTSYTDLKPLDNPYKLMGALIFLADRIDILLQSSSEPGWDAILRLSGKEFAPELVDLFMEVETTYGVTKHVKDLSYKDAIDAQLAAIAVSSTDAEDYLKMLVYSIDFRSPFTVAHTANTTSISTALSDMFGLDAATREDISMGAFLHDVGKIVIPYSILEYPGKLSSSEMALMRTHVIASGDILRGIAPDSVYEIAVRHHEKLNGSGYPLGLSASELDLPQRIVAVADILSALTGRRSYKESFPKDKSIGIIKSMRESGELCPRVCGMVVENYDEIIRRMNMEDDPVVSLYGTISKQYADLKQRTT